MMTTTFKVQRSVEEFPVSDLILFKQQMLDWSHQFGICCFLDNNQYPQQYHSSECLLAVEAVATFSPAPGAPGVLPALKQFLQQHSDWLFGHFNYDFAHAETGALPASTTGTPSTGFPNAYLFQPETVIQVQEGKAIISCLKNKPAEIYSSILQSQKSKVKSQNLNSQLPTLNSQLSIHARFTQQEYLHVIQQLQQHILRGDCYEINFCQEFYADSVVVNPAALYNRLTALSPTPFAAFYRLHDQYAICASPERYVRKTGSSIISQPIKGTAARLLQDTEKDLLAREALLHSAKDRSENVMVVDLVRNDLSKICEEGSVFVEELFGIYSFPQVHQMISTIKGTLLPGMDLADVLEASFPMGSMTGAPKKRVMELIAQYERSQRGLYSGTIGYISPEGDFDFNVVIRSIFYNAAEQYLSYQVGGGITFYSNAEKEYEECLLKAKAIQKALQ
jgi:para-aminobenzoate synthetase component 1